MNRIYKKLFWPILAFLLFQPGLIQAKSGLAFFNSEEDVGLYRLFETEINNSKNYGNPFTEVTLEVQFQAPSGRLIEFWGFFDGDGQGGAEGNIWKIRYMPDETGTWNYFYRWSDGSEGGKGTFECTSKNAGKGILQAYNPVLVGL